MITLKTITGLLIAAVLHVPGTTQREVAKVEEESVVKEESYVQQEGFWFQVENDGTIGQYLGQGATGESQLDPECGLGEEQPCGIMLTEADVTQSPGNDPQPHISNVLDQEDELSGPYDLRNKP